MFTFLHAADLHLDSPLRGLERYPGAPVDEVRGATRRALENLVRLAIDERVAFVIIAGDIFDGDWRDYNTGDFFRRQMAILHEAGIPVIAIRGNHDAASQITKQLRLPGSFKELSTSSPESFPIDDLAVMIHGQGFAKRDVTEDLSARYPSPERSCFNIGVLHTCAEGTPDHDAYAPCSLAGLRSLEYDYWALGHIHQRALLCSDPPILFPGNIQGRSVRECGPRGCSLVRVVDGRVETPIHVDLDVVRWRHERIDVTGCCALDEALDRARQSVLRSLEQCGDRLLAVRLSLMGPCDAHSALERDPERVVLELRSLVEDASEGRAWVEKVEIGTRAPADLTSVVESDEAMGELLRLIRELESDEEGCRALASDFRKLKNSLPRDIQALESGLEVDDGRVVAEVLGDVEQILVNRLLEAVPAV